MQPLIGQMRDQPKAMRGLTGVVLFFLLWLNIHPAVAATKEEIERQQKATHSQRLKALETGQTLQSLRGALVTVTGRTASPAALYSKNIQIADLNALNALLAVVKWKKLFDFYADMEREHNALYLVSGNEVINGDNE